MDPFHTGILTEISWWPEWVECVRVWGRPTFFQAYNGRSKDDQSNEGLPSLLHNLQLIRSQHSKLVGQPLCYLFKNTLGQQPVQFGR